MTLDDLRHILDLVREHELAEFELEHDGMKLRLRKQAEAAPAAVVAAPLLAPPLMATAVPPPSMVGGGASAAPIPPDEEGEELAIVTAPIVGTFYRAPSPDAPSFVEIGGHVRRGQSLCIIEAMKLMNEIESEYEGEVVKVFVENGQPVQYGERLFAIRRD